MEKKEPKKATVKRCTARLTEASLLNNGTTVATTVEIRLYYYVILERLCFLRSA